MNKAFFLLPAMLLLMGNADCEGTAVPDTSNKNVQAEKARAAANQINFTENAEIDNIKRRLELTSQPGLLGFVVLLNDMGQPVMYTTVKGKITSGSKRLTPTYTVEKNWDVGQYFGDKELPAASDEGTYGSSAEYVFFWTEAGQYIQWNGSYLYSDKPFRLSMKPLVLDVQGAEK